MGDSLGSGQFGRVYRGVNSENGEFVAIKQLKSSLMDESAVVAFESEIALLEKLHHENIVRYFSVIRGQEHINLVIECTYFQVLYYCFFFFNSKKTYFIKTAMEAPCPTS